MMNANINAFISGVFIYPMIDYTINANIDDFISFLPLIILLPYLRIIRITKIKVK